MKIMLIAITILAIAVSGCSSILSKTTGDGAVGANSSKRSFGRQIDDQLIETYVKTNIKKDEGLKGSNIGVVSYNGIVLLIGQVKSEHARSLAEDKAKIVRNVRRVHNELEVSGPISFPARTNDLWLKTKIKTSMLTTEGLNPLRIKAVVEDGAVYLMGLVSNEEADSAVELARKTYGIQKIVKVFEYTNPPQT